MLKTLLAILGLHAAAADQYTIAFRGLDEKYALTKNSISALREIISCRAGIPHTAVKLAAVTVKNTTWTVPENDEVNTVTQQYPRNCHLINTIHWDSVREPNAQRLLRDLHTEPQIEYTLNIPVSPSRAIGANIISFLVTSVDEKYADILASDYMAFYVGAKPELIPRHVGHMFGDDEYHILFYMFLVQVLILIIGNCIMKRARKTVPPLSRAAAYGSHTLDTIIIKN